MPKPILLGAIYVPPGQSIPQGLFDPYVNKSFYIFGDFNAEHTDWHCSNNNASGIQMKTWLDNTGCEMIYTNIPTLKKSSAVIDFGITHDAVGWKAEVIKEGTSDHYPVLIQSPLTTDILADHFEKHFETPNFDQTNLTHLEVVKKYQQFSLEPNIPLENISINEVTKAWKGVQKKKSIDNEGVSALLLHQLPIVYLQIITIAYNKIAQKGDALQRNKHAKVICLSKDGAYPTVDKLRPISILSNIGKCFERIIHARILKWCRDKGIFIDEQSGFTSERRLQTRILSLV
ncbi:unnamed protein product [Rotaria magnacalcarata]|nr:unnamed protein product [Rotaria magnacalcarata]CAF2264346.1 unnamed protein product [Rotaria magnacalcarata]